MVLQFPEVAEFPRGQDYHNLEKCGPVQNKHIARVRKDQNVLPCACSNALTRLLGWGESALSCSTSYSPRW